MQATEPIKVGDILVVEPSRHTSRKSDPRGVEVRVTKAARVWLEMTEIAPDDKYTRSWRMRRDTQDSGDRNYASSNSHFFTPEQFSARMYDSVMAGILKEHWIEINPRSKHHGDKEFRNGLAHWLLAWELSTRTE